MKIIKLKCSFCKSFFERELRFIKGAQKRRNQKNFFCYQKCKHKYYKIYPNKIKCLQCNSIIKNPGIKKFCNRSCAATYNNTHKTKGTRISKLELWLQEQLLKIYPKLEFYFNRKDTINSELDIYIPSLKLAFELNGIFHYEPIYGSEKLAQIQNNDSRKFQACLERNISLCIIDTSKYSYFKEQTAKKFLDIIINIINFSCGGGN